MSHISINLQKEDIHTIEKDGKIIVECNNNIDLVFTIEAIEELMADYLVLKQFIK